MLSEWYAKNLVRVLESMPVERAVLDLFAELTLSLGTEVADVGCGTGRLLSYLAGRSLSPGSPAEEAEPAYGYMLVRMASSAIT